MLSGSLATLPLVPVTNVAARRRIESETELAQVEAWLQKLTRAESWADLLAAGA